MFDRASIIDAQFINRCKKKDFPAFLSKTTLNNAGLEKQTTLDLFDSQIKSRLLDIIARQLKEKGLSFYTIGSSGHEGNVVFGQVFRHSDMAFLHYRSGAFYLQRAKQLAGTDGVLDILLSLVASANDPIAGGRHKVFGSVPLTIPPQTSTIASHLPKALGTALSITRAKELAIQATLLSDSIILCSFGDASINHASAQTTLNCCSWIRQQNYPLPILFICEDNGIGISVATPANWIENTVKQRPGIHYLTCDGLNIADTYKMALVAEQLVRTKKQPVFLHIRCVRLMGHAGSDIELQYNSEAEIIKREDQDPLLYTASLIYQQGWLDIPEIIDLYQNNRNMIEKKSISAVQEPRMQSATVIMSSILPRYKNKIHYLLPKNEQREKIFANQYTQLSSKKNLCQQINFALTDLMIQYPNILVFGEDVGKKGGVYRVTADLQQRFGQRRVFDTLLDETIILGTAIGFAHNGFIPIPEIQFLAYFHNAEDQIRGEAATLSFFSSGQYQNPMVIRIAGLAYQKGFGGHFHNDNSIAVLRDLPGVILACPSNGPDAAKMLRTCLKLAYEEGRVVIFLEPIALYMTKDLHAPEDNGWLFAYPTIEEHIKYGEVGCYGEGEIVILSYANGYYLSRQAAQVLEDKYGIKIKVIDIRWLSPLPEKSLLAEITDTHSVLIVDEGRKSASLSEGLITLLVEKGPTNIKIKRLTGEDCFIPLGTAWQYVLPSRESIINAALELKQESKTVKHDCQIIYD